MLVRLTAHFAALAALLMPIAAQAARVSPMIVDLEPSGNGSVARVELTNDAARDIPFEVRLMRGEISDSGELTLTPADDDFLVFPAQSIVEARSQQVFRLQYVGNPDLGKSGVYYMSIQQVPVQVDPNQSQVQVVINYNVLVNVVPRGTAPAAIVQSVEATLREPEIDPEEPNPATPPEVADAASADDDAAPTGAAAQPGLIVRLANDGTRFFMAGMSQWNITGTTEAGEPYSRTHRPEEMTRVIGVGVVAPDRTRSFFVPTETLLLQDSVRVEVKP